MFGPEKDGGLAVILDLYSRRVIGWATGDRLKQDLALRALNMALALRKATGLYSTHRPWEPILRSLNIKSYCSNINCCRP